MSSRGKAKDLLKKVGYRVASAFAIKPQEWTREDLMDFVFAFGLFFSSVIAAGRWWLWRHELAALHSAILWTVAAVLIFLLAPSRPRVLVGALGISIFYGLKGAILDQLFIGWVIVGVAVVLGLIVVGVAPSSFEKYSGRRIGWGFRTRRDD